MNKPIIAGAVLSLIGTTLIVGTLYAAFQAGNTLNTNDAIAVSSFAAFLTEQIGPLFFAGIALLGGGVLIFAVKFLLWLGRKPQQEQN